MLKFLYFLVMDYKYRTLLQNVPVRHLINKMKMDNDDIEKQLKRLTNVDLNNIFLFSTIKNAEKYLSTANNMEEPMNTKKTKWFVLTKVWQRNKVNKVNKNWHKHSDIQDDEASEKLQCNCVNMPVVIITPESTMKPPSAPSINGVSAIDAAFYRDSVDAAIKAVR